MFFLNRWNRNLNYRKCFIYTSSKKEVFYFHCFGLDYTVNKNDFVGTLPVAIVEDKEGKIRYLSLENFQFKFSLNPFNIFRSIKHRKVLFGKDFSEKGFFHFFAQDYFLYSKKDYAYTPVALLEDKKRRIRVVKADQVKFIS